MDAEITVIPLRVQSFKLPCVPLVAKLFHSQPFKNRLFRTLYAQRPDCEFVKKGTIQLFRLWLKMKVQRLQVKKVYGISQPCSYCKSFCNKPWSLSLKIYSV